MSRPGRGRLVFGAVRFGLPASNDRSGASESLVTSPAHTRSQSASSSSASVASFVAPRSSDQKLAPRCPRCSRTASWMRPDGGSTGSVDGSRSACLIAEEQANASVSSADRSRADPYDIARGAQRVEVRGRVPAQPRREHVGLERRRDDRRALQLPEHFDQTVDAVARPGVDAVPCQREPRVRIGLDGLDLAAQRCERSPPQLAQHVDVTPLALDAVGPELTADDSSLGLEGGERGHDALDGGSEPGRGRSSEERPVRCGIARDQVVERMLCRRGAHRGKPERNRGAEPVAEPPRIVRVREPVGATDTHRDRTPRGDELVDALAPVDVGRAPRRDLVERQVAEQPQQVVHLVAVRALGDSA